MEGFAFRAKSDPEAGHSGWLDLKRLLPSHMGGRDMRRLVYAKLDRFDRIMVEVAYSGELDPHSYYEIQVECACRGYPSILAYLFTPQQCPGDRLTKYASKHGQINVLAWLLEHKILDTYKVCPTAAKHGHTHVLEWARAQGLPWDEHTCIQAARAGHLETLVYALDHGCKWDMSTCLNAAFEAPAHVHFVYRPLEYQSPDGVKVIVDSALRINCKEAFGHVCTFQWLWARSTGRPRAVPWPGGADGAH